jgi:hypothetical protein
MATLKPKDAEVCKKNYEITPSKKSNSISK